MSMTIEKKFVSVTGTRCGHLLDRFGERHAERLRLDDLAEFAAHRLRRFVGDDAQRVAERQAGLDAAHDDVERIGKCGR